MKTLLFPAVVAIAGASWACLPNDGQFALFAPSVSSRADDQTKHDAAPEFTQVTEWLNSKPIKLAEQKGKVVVVHFWTNGCINCIHN